MSKSTSCYPSLSADATGTGVVSQAGAITLLRTAEKTGLTAGLSAALSPWRKPLATHDPGKIVLDLAVAVAVGGDCLADVALLREEPGVFGSGGLGPDGVPTVHHPRRRGPHRVTGNQHRPRRRPPNRVGPCR